ncbi:uncharacterized protein KY384_009235 [Bacidia gigantensis]|uniref:uncharacterized protein n=1 Tax=Bacidia gigantensis TaxID=2732470 RepID=UPI001D0500F6|nr:uncharacterized protein KY384_009235 [Bacidia gigantensis]KAG8525591.1 hypothetical protein KY384_009235 [Bacidia gigantensis]
MPQLTLYDLSASRSIRTAWLLEELSLPYALIHADRSSNGLSDADFKAQTGTILGKAPVLKDGSLTIQESGAITEYLISTYDPEDKHGLLPKHPVPVKMKILEFVHAAEATLMLHCLPFIYAKRVAPSPFPPLEQLQPGLQAIVRKDLDWLEAELEKKGEGWLVGDGVSAADTMMGFSVMFIFANSLAGEAEGKWKRILEWIRKIEDREAYKRAVEKTGFVLKPQ